MNYAFVMLPRDIGKPLPLGPAIISVLTPDGLFVEKIAIQPVSLQALAPMQTIPFR
ncbi:MAG: hypothetical protein RBR19_09370 [Sedimentisphaerales bacterium]|jgi:hypothetical protein|nr:hypothetical protein [Sedimentisphaerales bacterium]